MIDAFLPERFLWEGDESQDMKELLRDLIKEMDRLTFVIIVFVRGEIWCHEDRAPGKS
jgi:hypothetical protein